MFRYWKAIIVILSFALLASPTAAWAASSLNPGPDLFLTSAKTHYICPQNITQRYPNLCPDYSPGARATHIEYLRARLPHPLPALDIEEMETPDDAITPYTFAYIRPLPASSYKHPEEAAAGLPPVRDFLAGDNWVSVMGTVEYEGETWYEINPNEFVHADHIAITRPSRFRGVRLNQQPAYPFAWINRHVNPSTLPGEAPGAEVTLPRYDRVTIFGQQMMGDELWYMIGPDQWIEQQYVSRIDVDPRPEGVEPDEKWIEVDTFEETLTAYEGDRMVFATLISSGRGAGNWTPEGLSRIWGKLPSTPMSNKEVTPDSPAWYYLENVEWTQYFNGAYAIHAAYWHDSFGFPRSHGCVNLTISDAKWLFQWTTPYTPEDARIVYSNDADPGTWVWVHHANPFPEAPAEEED